MTFIQRQLSFDTLRLISVCQYFHVPASSSYSSDEENYYLNFLKATKKKEVTENLQPIDLEDMQELGFVNTQGLYYVAG